MNKSILANFIDKLIRVLDRTVNPETIKTFVINKYGEMISTRTFLDEGSLNNIYLIEELMVLLGWLEKRKRVITGIKISEVQDIREIQNWLNPIEETIVVKRNIVKVGSGKYLDILDRNTDKKQKSSVLRNLERLLRHIEVKRNLSLTHFDEKIDKDQIWLERHSICILFCRVARRHNDLRFLNAALKLNDFYFREYQKRKLSNRRTSFLLALCEQEYTAMELLS